jgi:hypothetical protein
MNHQLTQIENLLRRRNWTFQIYTQRETVTVDILDLDDELVDSFTAPNLFVAFATLSDWSSKP